MLSEAIKSVPVPLRSNLPWIVFVAGVAVQLLAMRMAAHRTRGIPPAPIDEPNIIASRESPTGADHILGLPAMTEPVAGARVPSDPDLLPGAERGYRGGRHEGVDFNCRPGTPVLAVSDGWVLSIDDEPNLPEARRNEVLHYCTELGETPPEVLQVLHGRRLVLCHGVQTGELVTTSYSHLGTVRSDLKPGVHVHGGEVIGTAGSSGTSHAYRHDDWGEVHFEIRLDGQPLGLGRPPKQTGALYRECLGEEGR